MTMHNRSLSDVNDKLPRVTNLQKESLIKNGATRNPKINQNFPKTCYEGFSNGENLIKEENKDDFGNWIAQAEDRCRKFKPIKEYSKDLEELNFKIKETDFYKYETIINGNSCNIGEFNLSLKQNK